MILDYFYLFLIFIFISITILLIVNIYSSFMNRVKISGRLKTLPQNNQLDLDNITTKISDQKVLYLINRLSKLSLPSNGWQDSKINLKFIRAGLRDPIYIKIFYAIKSFLFL